MKRIAIPTTTSSLELYLSEINRFPLLTVDEEQRLARLFRDEGDTRAAHRLVTANLRFVVKVSYEYRSYGFKMADLIQEGNIGLMKAVQKFDPDKGIRLISYAVWWIRAYIQNYILKSWSLVKLGTTQAQRKLFFSLARTKRELDKMSRRARRRLRRAGQEQDRQEAPREDRPRSRRWSSGWTAATSRSTRRWATTAATRTSTSSPRSRPAQDDELSDAEEQQIVASKVTTALARLDQRERYIIEQRVMSDRPLTLKELGEHFGFSRERARQLEIRAKEKLKQELHALAAEIDWPTNGRPVDIDDAALA